MTKQNTKLLKKLHSNNRTDLYQSKVYGWDLDIGAQKLNGFSNLEA